MQRMKLCAFVRVGLLVLFGTASESRAQECQVKGACLASDYFLDGAYTFRDGDTGIDYVFVEVTPRHSALPPDASMDAHRRRHIMWWGPKGHLQRLDTSTM